MTKHVFRTGESYLHHSGEFVRETEQMVYWRASHWNEERRGYKADHIILETNDPDGVVKAFDAAYREHSPATEEARLALVRAEGKRRRAASAAALAKAEATR